MEHTFDVALSFATEDQKLVERVYDYLRAEGLRVFFAPSQEGQAVLSGKNQRQIFYQIFGWEARYAALFVSKHYLRREIPMEEARIALSKREGDGTAIPIYLEDDAVLPLQIFDPSKINYFRSSYPEAIATHLAMRCTNGAGTKTMPKISEQMSSSSQRANGMLISGNIGGKQIFIQNHQGDINL